MNIDKSKINPIPVQKSIALINNFVVTTASFFNAFAETIEKKITTTSNKITELEILLTVLEEKLNSVPGLEAVSTPASTSTPTATSSSSATANPAAPAEAPANMPEPMPMPAPPAPSNSLADDPDYGPFIKMMKVGVPKFVVVAKASAAGLDGSKLEAFEL